MYYGSWIYGGSGTNTLIGPNGTNTWNITAADEGTIGTFGFTGMQNLVGGTGVDTFKFTAATSQVTSIDGGGAPTGQGDWLDYSAYPAAVTVKLATGTATGTATGVTGTVRNIQDVFGGNFGNTLTGDAQGNILIGGTGSNTITGGTGASVLIGGKGNATVTGGSGGDILIGGSTTYDQAHNEAALMSILAEWQSGKSYATRLHDLKFGGGLNGSNTLVLGTTVLDDGGTDVLTGGNFIPGALDWFFQGVHGTIHNYESPEQIN
jgi:Ca2+-binding RTX toxin-like protein